MSFRELISVDPTAHRRKAETGDLEHNCRPLLQRTWAALPLLSADSTSCGMQHAGFYTIGGKTECVKHAMIFPDEGLDLQKAR